MKCNKNICFDGQILFVVRFGIFEFGFYSWWKWSMNVIKNFIPYAVHIIW